VGVKEAQAADVDTPASAAEGETCNAAPQRAKIDRVVTKLRPVGTQTLWNTPCSWRIPGKGEVAGEVLAH